MASDKQQIRRMEAHRAELLKEGKLSYPSGSGRIAVFTMYDPAKAGEVTRHADRLETIDAEARRLCGYLRWRGRHAVCFPEATIGEFWEAMDDVRVSDMVVIGLAQLSGVHIAPWTPAHNPDMQHRTVNFFDAISRTGRWPTITHLKTGSFYQRTSGGMERGRLNVPFAWGFMADRARIWAAPQQLFYPSRWNVRPRAGLVNLATHFGLGDGELRGAMSYERTKEIFASRELLDWRRYPVPEFTYPLYDWLRDSPRIHQAHDIVLRRMGIAAHALTR